MALTGSNSFEVKKLLAVPKNSTLYRASVIDESYNTNLTKEFIWGVMEKDSQDGENILLNSTLTAQSLFESIFPLLFSNPEGKDKIKNFFKKYMHYMLTLWFYKVFKQKCRGYSSMTVYADDFVGCYQYRSDA